MGVEPGTWRAALKESTMTSLQESLWPELRLALSKMIPTEIIKAEFSNKKNLVVLITYLYF